MDNNLQTSGEITTGDQSPSVVEPMAPKVLEALRGSIAKWEGIVAGIAHDEGPLNCPLCQMFHRRTMCRGCPVMDRTGQDSCKGTPYDNYDRDLNPAWAQAEVDFLKSLLPDDKATSALPDRSEPTQSQEAR